jgi:hypothetical protein
VSALLALLMAGQTVEAMRGERRVLIVAAPVDKDVRLARQNALLKANRAKLDDRDVTVVLIVGGDVLGVREPAATLRRRWRLPPNAFGVVLIGKDGREALRRADPIDGTTLTAAIDAMPMRRAGLR